MIEIPATRAPRDPPEKRDCCKPKRKLAPLRVTSAQHTVVEETVVATDGAIIDEVSVSVACDFEETEIMDLMEDGLADEILAEDSATEEPPRKRTKLPHDLETTEDAKGTTSDFKEIWGSPKQDVPPNSRRNKDMLWSLIW